MLARRFPSSFPTLTIALASRRSPTSTPVNFLASWSAGAHQRINSEGTFRPDRIKAIAERFNVDPVAALENIVFARAHNSEHRSSFLRLSSRAARLTFENRQRWN